MLPFRFLLFADTVSHLGGVVKKKLCSAVDSVSKGRWQEVEEACHGSYLESIQGEECNGDHEQRSHDQSYERHIMTRMIVAHMVVSFFIMGRA